MDRYSSFDQLKTFEQEGLDFRVRWRIGSSGIAILSIHGGEIEPGTSLIADAIAGSDHTYYALEGLKSSGNRALHITSTQFDEPIAIDIVCRSAIIISIHGCAEPEQLIYVGGRDLELRRRIRQKLKEAGFMALEAARSRFVGTDLANICNLCGRGMGVQLEISRGLRSLMLPGTHCRETGIPNELLVKFADAVREAIEPFKEPADEWATSAGCEE